MGTNMAVATKTIETTDAVETAPIITLQVITISDVVASRDGYSPRQHATHFVMG
jgi:hypothetical protein